MIMKAYHISIYIIYPNDSKWIQMDPNGISALDPKIPGLSRTRQSDPGTLHTELQKLGVDTVVQARLPEQTGR